MAKQSDEEKKSGGPGFRLGLFLGLIAGATVGAMIASNERAREQASGVWRQAEQSMEGVAAQTGAEDITGKARATITRIRTRFREAVEEGKEAAQETELKEYERYEEMTGREPTSEEKSGQA